MRTPNGAIRINGLVALANRVREGLAGGAPAQRVADYRAHVHQALGEVHAIVARHGRDVSALPLPSRRAYRYLLGLDFDALTTNDGAAEPTAPRVTRFDGLRRTLDGLLDGLAQPLAPSEVFALAPRVAAASASIERRIAARRLEPQQLTAETRAIRGWLAYFAAPERLLQYGAAIERAHGCFARCLGRQRRFRGPPRVHLRPLRGLYRLRGDADGTRVFLPTPMLSFDASLFDSLAMLALRQGGDRQRCIDAMTGGPYQGVQAAIESLGGIVERTRGAFHDLAESFQRVDLGYFQGSMARPRLSWNRTYTRRKFGHYDPVGDQIMVSASLDDAAVPAWVVDYIVYHEMLHKRHGVSWRGGRAHVHTQAFRREERQFMQFREAEQWLTRLASARR